MKKILALVLALAMALALVACGGNSNSSTSGSTPSSEPVASTGDASTGDADASGSGETSGDVANSITLWPYPIGNWGDEAAVKELTDAFTAETGISVTVEYLDYTNGDDRVNTAITANQNSRPDYGRPRASGGQLGRQRLPGGPVRHAGRRGYG